MESKTYTLIVRTNTGVWNEKVKVNADLETCKLFISSMMRTSSKNNRGEIIEGERDYVMDCRVKPVLRMKLNADGSIVEDN